MPPRHVKGAQRSNAQALLAAKGGAPDGLSSFLGGFVAGGASGDASSPVAPTPQEEQEGAIAMNLKLLTKSSDITKQKSLNELVERVAVAREDSLSQFVPNIAEAVIQHSHYLNPQIRASVFALLKVLMGRGKGVKVSLVSSLPALAPEWIMGMHDMEAPVRQEAKAAFEAAFSAEKRPAMLLKYKDDIVRVLCEDVTDIASSGKPLQDDQLDRRSNHLFSALRGLGYMVKQVSASQSAVLAFILEQPAFMKVLPSRSAQKNYIADKTPLVRSAALALLRDVISVCPCTARLHQLVAQAVQGAILDTDATVAAREWELLLFWCRSNMSDVVANLPKGFLDEVVDSFMECKKPELAEVIFPCLFPFLTQLSKDARLGEVLDEFCGALVEKLRVMGETPNVSAQEVEVVFQALMECWELHCVRKRGTPEASDCEELFSVILTNLCTLLLAPAKRRRYQSVVVKILSESLDKTLTRNELAFRHCVAILTGQLDAPFIVLPPDSEAALVESYRHLRAVTTGALYATAVRAGTYSRQLPLLEGYVVAMVHACITEKDTASLVALLDGAGPAYHPSAEVKGTIVDYLLAVIPTLKDSPEEDARTTGEGASCKALLAVALSWNDKSCVERLTEVTKGKAMTGVQQAVKDHLLKDPTKAFDVLVLSCETSAFDDVKQCAQQLSDSGATLAHEQQSQLLQAVVTSLTDTLGLVKGDDATKEREKFAAAAASSSSSSGSSDDSSSEEDGTSGSDGSGTDGTSSEDSESGSDEDSDASPSPNDDDEGTSAGAPGAEETEANQGPEVLLRVAEWVELLQPRRPLAQLLGLTVATLTETLLPYFYRLVAAVAPPLLPEYYISIKGLRVALVKEAESSEDEEADSESDEDEHESPQGSANARPFRLGVALEEKVHSLRTGDFALLVSKVGELLDGYAVSAESRDAFATSFLAAIAQGDVPLCCEAFHQFQQVVPFASQTCFQQFTNTMCNSDVYAVRHSTPDTKAAAAESLSLFDGYFSLSEIDVSLFSVVRAAQLLRLMESSGSVKALSGGVSENEQAQQAARILFYLLKAAVAKEAFSPSTRSILFDRLLPQALAHMDSKEAATALTSLVVGDSGDDAYLLVTLAAVIRDVARATDAAQKNEAALHFLLCGRRLVSAVTAGAVEALFTPDGARGIAKDLATLYTSFFNVMDEAANAVKDNLLAQLPKPLEQLFNEACMMLPTWDTTTAKLSLVVHRHLSTMPVVAESTVKSLIEYAQKQNPLECLELLAELSMTRILVLPAYSEVVRVIIHALCRCYTLRHLPTNGRLTQLPADRAAPPALPFHQLRRIAVAAVTARRGVVIHSRADDVLRSTVNLVVFDIVCEAVSRLRSTKEGEAPLLAKLIAFTTDFMSELLTSDVAVLRASEASVTKIASVMCFAYLWVSVTPIAKLEAIGMDTVAAVMRSVCQLANLTLTRSGTPLQEAMRPITERISLKPLRNDYSSSNQIKVARFRRQNALIGKTHKQRLLLFPYLLAHAIGFTSAAAPNGEELDTSSYKEKRDRLCSLLDLLLSLLFTPYVSKKKGARLEDTFIGTAIGAAAKRNSGAGDDGNPFAGMLGFEVVALTRTDDLADPMSQLARGAASVLTLLLTGATLSFVKGWLDTLERKLQALLHDFVEVYVSPTLIQENLLTVLSHSPDGATTFNTSDEMSVHVGMAQRCIDLAYEMEDAKVSVSIHFPPAYPLRKPTVDFGSGRECGISDDKWRAWMLKMTVLLFSGTSSTWECVELFRRNLDAHLDAEHGGHEPCPICFAVVNAVNHRLPDKRCAVCQNSAFHSSCLYTWWANGGQNICPLCRSPWIAE